MQRVDSHLDLLQLHESNSQRYPFLLQSVAHGTPQARFDILFAFPGQTLTLHKNGQLDIDGVVEKKQGFLRQLDQLWRAQPSSGVEGQLPFRGGWFLYLSYELAGEVEPTLRLPPSPGRLPVALAVRIPAAIIVDHQQQATFLIAEEDELLECMQADIRRLATAPNSDDLPQFQIQEASAQEHLDGVERVKHYIHEGDVFQVNLSRLWRAEAKHSFSPVQLYRRLCQTNPAPFAGLMQWQDNAVVSSSPERLVAVHAGQVETRPIAGTRRRDKDVQQDRDLSAELMRHPKERAEHVMLLDLERNDLGRVCIPGTVEVNEMMVLESYAHVHHIVSNVRGRLRPEITPGEVIRAVFPGGTITGCPKVRCMEILAELEREGRGAYTGSMGYLNHNGDMDLNILIRTVELADDVVYLRAGGGIVADSEPERELQETRTKAKGMLLSLGEDV